MEAQRFAQAMLDAGKTEAERLMLFRDAMKKHIENMLDAVKNEGMNYYCCIIVMLRFIRDALNSISLYTMLF